MLIFTLWIACLHTALGVAFPDALDSNGPCPPGKGANESAWLPGLDIQCDTCPDGYFCRQGSVLKKYGSDKVVFHKAEFPFEYVHHKTELMNGSVSPAFIDASSVLVGDEFGNLTTHPLNRTYPAVLGPASPTFYDGTLYVGTGDGKILRFNYSSNNYTIHFDTNLNHPISPRFNDITGELFATFNNSWIQIHPLTNNWTTLTHSPVPTFTLSDIDTNGIQDFVWVEQNSIQWIPSLQPLNMSLRNLIPLPYVSNYSYVPEFNQSMLVVGSDSGELFFFQRHDPSMGEVQLCQEEYWCPPGSIDAQGRTNSSFPPNECSSGNYCPTGTGLGRTCPIIPQGHYCPNTTTLIPCQFGELCELTNLTHPMTCPEGSFCRFGVQSPCSPLHYCPENTPVEFPCDVEDCSSLIHALNYSQWCDPIIMDDTTCKNQHLDFPHPIEIHGGVFQNCTLLFDHNASFDNTYFDSTRLDSSDVLSIQNSVVTGNTSIQGHVVAQHVRFSTNHHIVSSGHMDITDSILRFFHANSLDGANNSCFHPFATNTSICSNATGRASIDFSVCSYSDVWECPDCRGTQAFWGAPCTNCTAGNYSIEGR